MEWLSIPISFSALCVSLVSLVLSYRHTVTQVTHSLHSRLFDDLEDYKILYRSDERDKKYYFDSGLRGAEGNFVGSLEEARIDNFLERLNFICMWLLKVRTIWFLKAWSVDEEMLFKKYIHRLYTRKFFEEYFTFLDRSVSVPISGPYYEFIHKYAHDRLGLRRPNVAVPGPPQPKVT